jgi:multiple sugar transport system permease protein
MPEMATKTTADRPADSPRPVRGPAALRSRPFLSKLKGSGQEVSEGRLGWMFVAPICVFIVVLVGYPVILAFQTSVQSVGLYPGAPSKFVGLDNYADVLTDDQTISAAVHTAVYWVIAITVELGVGLVAALALRHPFRGRGLILALVVLPWALPPVVAGLLWTRIFDPSSGWLNGLLYQLHIIDDYKLWFAGPETTLPLIAVVHAWGLVPLVTLILLGGLQGIPSDLYEAAALDGASAFNRFRSITLPLLRPSVAAALTIGTIVSFAVFDVIYVLTGTDRDSRSVMVQIYLTTFANLDFGHGVALAILLAMASLFMSGVYLVAFRRSVP